MSGGMEDAAKYHQQQQPGELAKIKQAYLKYCADELTADRVPVSWETFLMIVRAMLDVLRNAR